MRSPRQYRRLALITPLALVSLVVGCSGDGQNQSAAEQSSATSTAPPSPSNELSGSWAEQPGQSDKITQTLTANGFECTEHNTQEIDLRMCTKSLPGKTGDQNGAAQRIRFVADGKGTVVRAAVDGNTIGDAGKQMRTQVLQALLPAEDVAIIQAKGTKISWGAVAKSQETEYFTVKGGESRSAQHAPSSPMLEVTKEKALPTLQEAGLKCEFREKDKWGTPRSGLHCTDPTFEAPGDGSIQGATAEATLVDGGQGIISVILEGTHSKTPENTRAVKNLLPEVFGITSDQNLPAVRTWIDGHLDGRAHSAYVDNWLVNVDIVEQSMLGSSVRVTVKSEVADFGFSAK